jgi:uncharacterized protein YwgA
MTPDNRPSMQHFSDRESQLLSLLSDAGDEDGQLLGRMKLMKLVFFSEYWKTESNRLTPNRRIGGFDDFKIYKYGPFSESLLHTFDDLKQRGLITEQEQMYGPTRICLTEDGRQAAQVVKDRLSSDEIHQIEGVVQHFGSKDGNELEEESLERLGITREQKKNHQGKPVESLIR